MILKMIKWSFLTLLILMLFMVFYYCYLYLNFDTKNLPEHHGKVHAKLYLGDGNNQPLIVGLGGSEGGNAWASDYWKDQREKYIAQGYAFLAIGYFGMKGIPKQLDRIALEGVYQAINKATMEPKINPNCVSLIGGSKGAELALNLASKYPNIKAVVAIVPGQAVFAGLTDLMSTSSFTYNGQELDFVPVTWSVLPSLIKGDFRATYEELIKEKSVVEKASIEIENINGPILFVSATQDEMWPSTEMSNDMMQRLKQNNFKFHHAHIAIKGNHAAPLKHFDQIDEFLNQKFLKDSQTNCLRNIN